MKFVIERTPFLSALSRVQHIVARRTVSPILSNVLLIADADQLTLTTTDLDVSVSEIVSIHGQVSGGTTVSVHTLHDIVRKLPDGANIELRVAGETHQLVVKCGRSRFHLPILPTEDFAPFKMSEMPHHFTVAADALNHLVSQTRFCMSTEEARYFLNGIYLHEFSSGTDKFLRSVATDGHRLALAEIPEPQGSEGMPGVIIPRKTVGELARLVDSMTGDIEISLSLTQIAFSCETVQLQSRLIDGTFPNYNDVIPSETEHTLSVDVNDLSAAVDRVALLSQDKSNGIKMTIEKSRILVSASSADHGSALEEVETDYQGDRYEIGFNARYVLDILHQIDSPTLTLKFQDEQAPVILNDSEADDMLFILMPMRV